MLLFMPSFCIAVLTAVNSRRPGTSFFNHGRGLSVVGGDSLWLGYFSNWDLRRLSKYYVYYAFHIPFPDDYHLFVISGDSSASRCDWRSDIKGLRSTPSAALDTGSLLDTIKSVPAGIINISIYGTCMIREIFLLAASNFSSTLSLKGVQSVL